MKRRTTWRRDGFVSLHADGDGGELITAPLLTDPRWELHVNCAAVDGEITVALCDHQGLPLNEDGVEILSSSPYEPPSWVSQPIRTDATDIKVQLEQPIARLASHVAASLEVASTAVACQAADVIVTATNGREPIVMSEWVRPGTHLSKKRLVKPPFETPPQTGGVRGCSYC